MTELLPSLQHDLRREFPEVLVLYHPIYEAWQLYEKDRWSDWTVERLRQAIVNEWPEWWKTSGAPRVFEDRLEMEPGDWLLEFLRQKDHWRQHGGARNFVRELEERQQARRREKQEHMHREHRGMADDFRRHARDHMRGDPMAGRRKWLINVGDKAGI